MAVEEVGSQSFRQDLVDSGYRYPDRRPLENL